MESEHANADEDVEIAAACVGGPSWLTPEVVRDTLNTFRPLYKGKLTVKEAVEILQTFRQLYEVLKKDNRLPPP